MREILNGRVRVAEVVESGNSEPVIVSGLHPVTVVLIPDSADGKVQYTTSPESDIGNAVWRDWGAGEVAVTTESVFDGPVTALRAVHIGGSGVLTWEVVAEKSR